MLLQERRLNIRTLSWFLFPFLLFNLYLTKSQEIPISMHDMTEDVTITTNIRQTRCRQIGLPALDMTDNWNWIVFLKHLQLWTRRYFYHWSRGNWWWCRWVWMRHNVNTSISLPVSSRPSPHLNLIKFYRKRRVFWALFCPWTTNNLNIKQFCLIFRQQITVFPTQSSVSTILYIWIIRRAANLSFYWTNRGTCSSPLEIINLQSLLQCWTFSLTALQ